MTTTTTSPDQTKLLAKELLKTLHGGEVITLQGDLGSGKTTFTQGLAEGLGISQKVNSPTFLISKSYKTNNDSIKVLHHLDLYRLQHEKEIEGLGLKELLVEKDAITLIEWPERMGSLIPAKRIEILFEYIDETQRQITIKNYE